MVGRYVAGFKTFYFYQNPVYMYSMKYAADDIYMYGMYHFGLQYHDR